MPLISVDNLTEEAGREPPHSLGIVYCASGRLAHCGDDRPRLVPKRFRTHIPFAIASVIFYVMCAFALRSRTIAGTLWGLSIWPFNHACRWTRRMENSTLGVWNPWLGLGDRLGSHSFLQAAKVGFAKYLIPK